MIAVVSPEIQRGGITVKSAYNSAALSVHGIEPQYQAIRTIDIERGRMFGFNDEEEARARGHHRRRCHGAALRHARQPRPARLPERPALHGDRQDPEEGSGQQLQRARQRQGVRAVLGDGCATSRAPDAEPGVVSNLIVVAAAVGGGRSCPRCSTPHRAASRTSTGRSSGRSGASWRRGTASIPTDRNAVAMWDTTLQTLMFGRMIEHMNWFFALVGVVTLALGGLGVMNIMLVAVRERTREIGVRKALGATTGHVQRQFFLEGFLLTMLSGAIGFAVALGAVHGGEPAADAGAVPGHGADLAGRRRGRGVCWC